ANGELRPITGAAVVTSARAEREREKRAGGHDAERAAPSASLVIRHWSHDRVSRSTESRIGATIVPAGAICILLRHHGGVNSCTGLEPAGKVTEGCWPRPAPLGHACCVRQWMHAQHRGPGYF